MTSEKERIAKAALTELVRMLGPGSPVVEVPVGGRARSNVTLVEPGVRSSESNQRKKMSGVVMKTTEMVLRGVGEPETLLAQQRELDAPAPGQAVVRMDATGVSFAEQSMRRGIYYDQPRFPFVPGYDLVGTVEALGSPTQGLQVGGCCTAPSGPNPGRPSWCSPPRVASGPSWSSSPGTPDSG
jgi:Alcohol dehydrogenase GroES-like domain